MEKRLLSNFFTVYCLIFLQFGVFCHAEIVGSDVESGMVPSQWIYSCLCHSIVFIMGAINVFQE